MKAGASTSMLGSTGDINLLGGDSLLGFTSGGHVSVVGGSAVQGTGGNVDISGGTSNTGSSGSIFLFTHAGELEGGASGSLMIQTGNSLGEVGSVSLSSGSTSKSQQVLIVRINVFG